MTATTTPRLPGTRSFLRFARPHLPGFALVGATFTISNVATAIIPLVIGWLVGALTTGADPWPYVVMLIACSTGHMITWHGSELLYGRFVLPLSFRYETALFRNVVTRPYDYFVDKLTGKIGSYITGIAQELRQLLMDVFFEYIGQVVGLITVVAILTSINWQTGAIFLGGLLLLPLLGRWPLGHAIRTQRVETDVVSTKNGRVIDAVANFASVKAFFTDVAEIGNMIGEQRRAFRAARSAFRWDIVFWIFMSMVIRNAIWPAAIILNVVLYLNGEITIAQLTTVLTTAMLFSTTIWNLIWQVSYLSLKFARVEESHLYLFGPKIIDDVDPVEPESVPEFRDRLAIEGLSFAYPDQPDDTVIRDLSLTIRRGEKIGIVGRSGSGKSTLTKILLGYYPSQVDEIELDGRAVDIRSVARMIAFVPQDTSLFHRSIEENISYGTTRPLGRDDVEGAARRAQADEFIRRIDGGYDAMVGERGVKLSGGQRQRIAIARAVLKDAPILLLDEATSALDSESEVLIQEALDELMRDRTSIVIAHRLSTIAKMDRILVMEDGSLVEQGSHDELLAANGRYAKLWARQSGGFIEE
ncbi:ABC transporter ATP-binding protein [Pseudolysinimonas sp.]